MATLTVDTDNAAKAIKAIRKAQREAKKDESRKSELRSVALERAQASAFRFVQRASMDHLVGWDILRPVNGNRYDREGFDRAVARIDDCDTVRVETQHGSGTFTIYSCDRVSHVLCDGAGMTAAIRYVNNDSSPVWVCVGVADDVSYYQLIEAGLLELAEQFLGRLVAAKDAKRAAQSE